ncbi:ribonuclease H-like domain-containing protein [Penicillium daleae]|uniref:Ribonuclease H-like domain-containing protein n=1 Tax=Penicillium daleae TaxID=63821 RepID=A0AAD6CG45_9EURO|nr:ribonuclease H-like domain-containing protein [Penicillium daleae]KAJ5464748.1 ribonuclease H-like domain-containing protein [Penicillium daleae]
MVYPMEIYTDGGCRGNRRPGAIGAAAAVFKTKYGKYRGRIRVLPSYPPPTNQRAEITAIIVALEEALAKFRKLDTNPHLDVRVYSDSRYAFERGGKRRVWIPREENEIADRFCNEAMDEQ